VITDMFEVDGPAGRAVVVRLVGELTIDSAPLARSQLLKALAEQPAVIVADVSQLAVTDDVVLTLFLAIARHAAAWPGIPVVLAAPGRELAAALDRTAVMRYIPVVSTVDGACSEVDKVVPRRLVEHMRAGPAAVTAARVLVRDACTSWNLLLIADAAELVMSELASNAVRHVGGPLDVTVSARRRYLHLTVRDRSFDPPRPGHADGRGLLLVDAITVAWGCTEVEDGKVVWATLERP
jgi:anti-anti-sigma regulatory factor